MRSNRENIGSIIVVVGPSTVGKSTVCNQVIAQNLDLSEAKKLNLEMWGPDLASISGNPRRDRDCMQRAIDNAKEGKSTILDLGSVAVNGLLGRLKKQMRDLGFDCPILSCALHLPLKDLMARCKIRNEMEVDHNEITSDSRYFQRVFTGFQKMYGTQSEGGELRETGESLDYETFSQSYQLVKEECGVMPSSMLRMALEYGFDVTASPITTVLKHQEFDKLYSTLEKDSAVFIASDILEAIVERRMTFLQQGEVAASSSVAECVSRSALADDLAGYVI